MKELKLTTQINRSSSEVFEFCLNPENTPKWIDTITKEEANEQPAKLGTVYRNTSNEKHWNEYTITEFEEGRIFVMTSKDGSYHVRYTITPINKNSCELEYFEWTDKGELNEPFEMKNLDKLKEIIER